VMTRSKSRVLRIRNEQEKLIRVSTAGESNHRWGFENYLKAKLPRLMELENLAGVDPLCCREDSKRFLTFLEGWSEGAMT
jgi:hypothetical protein